MTALSREKARFTVAILACVVHGSQGEKTASMSEGVRDRGHIKDEARPRSDYKREATYGGRTMASTRDKSP